MNHPLSANNHTMHIARQVQKQTKRRFKLKTRTRLILVLFGSIAIVTAWFLPWYVMDYFLSPSAFQTAMHSGHYDALAELSGDQHDIQLYGTNIVQIQYSGAELAQKGFIHVDRTDLLWWLGLVALTLIAVKADELMGYQGVVGVVKNIIDGVKVLGLIGQVGFFLWYSIQATSRAWVTNTATTLMVHDLGSNNGLLHMTTGMSVGLISLALGLLLSSIGVMTGDKAQDNSYNPSKWSGIASLTATACLVIGLVYFFISYAIFL